MMNEKDGVSKSHQLSQDIHILNFLFVNLFFFSGGVSTKERF